MIAWCKKRPVHMHIITTVVIFVRKFSLIFSSIIGLVNASSKLWFFYFTDFYWLLKLLKPSQVNNQWSSEMIYYLWQHQRVKFNIFIHYTNYVYHFDSKNRTYHSMASNLNKSEESVTKYMLKRPKICIY